MQNQQSLATEIRTSVWDDLETLVFDRDDMQAALGHALEVLPQDDDDIAVDADALVRDDADDDAWLATIPAAAFEVLMRASRSLPADAPRLAFAIARPAHAHS